MIERGTLKLDNAITRTLCQIEEKKSLLLQMPIKKENSKKIGGKPKMVETVERQDKTTIKK